MSWRKVSVFECIGHYVFMDQYGFCRFEIKNITINGINLFELFAYKDESKTYERIGFYPSGNCAKFLADLFSIDIAQRKKTYAEDYGYLSDYLNSYQIESVKPKSIKVELSVHYRVAFNYNGGNQETSIHEIIELKSKEDIIKHCCWFEENADTSSFKMAILPETKVDDELYLVGVGKVKVCSLIKYPNKEDKVCEATDCSGKRQIIKMSSEVFYLPYGKIIDEYADLNHSIDELKLSPFVSRHNNQSPLYNIYWSKIEEARSYHVVLYKLNVFKNRRHVLQIADYEVDRNTCFLSLDNLAGDGFVFKVKAEDRNGNIIAESRGAISGLARNFEE